MTARSINSPMPVDGVNMGKPFVPTRLALSGRPPRMLDPRAWQAQIRQPHHLGSRTFAPSLRLHG